MKGLLVGAALGALVAATPARAQSVEELQRQIDELKAQVEMLMAERRALTAAPPPVAAEAPQAVARTQPEQASPIAPPVDVASASAVPIEDRPWYERIRLRGYTQMRVNEIVSGDATAPPGRSRLRSVHDGGITDQGNFSFRRIRLILEGDLSEQVSFYFQPDFATNVANRSAGERREGFGQLRDAYVDWFLDDDRRFRLRFGQSKVPVGWENLQSSSNRLALDRSDAINSAIPSERDLGVVAYYTPASVQRIWDRLDEGGQKLFGNYGAFGLAAYNGQGTNRPEQNNGLMTVAMATWPFELNGLGSAFRGQVIEVGGSLMRNSVRPEIRSGGVSAASFDDNRVSLHAMLYPQPFGVQVEWTWGEGPEFDPVAQAIATRPLNGGYVQSMWRVDRSPLGPAMPYARWQRYRGGWKATPNAPRLETDEFEIGIEFQPLTPIELTVAYAHMERREADERLAGRAQGHLIRTQLQWNY
jgi:outer membrane murein-binding lipoprotein Lpp